MNIKKRKGANIHPPYLGVYQSSSSCGFIALCLCLKASARPPAKLALFILFGVARPLPPDESCEFMLTALSRGAVGGAGLRPAIGRLAGGAGGVGFAFAAAREAPLVTTGFTRFMLEMAALGADGGGGGGGGAAAAGVGATNSSR